MNILKSSKILVNTHIDDTVYAGNMRLFEGTGMGCLVLTDFKKDLDKIFQIKKEIEVFNSTSELIEKCKYFLKNEKELTNISKKGNLRTLSDHTYEQRVLLLDEFIKSLDYEKNI
jgi:spore maturation protein CgeB